MDEAEAEQVVIEAAGRHNPSLFFYYSDTPRHKNYESALTWFRYNKNILLSNEKIFRIRRESDDFIWDQSDFENSILK
jgi:hypothetical protein